MTIMFQFPDRLTHLENVFSQMDTRIKLDIQNKVFDYMENLVSFIYDCQSPIEQLLVIHLYERFQQFADIWFEPWIFSVQEPIKVKTKTYYPDIYLAGVSKQTEKRFEIAVECDGHEFHERTKEQAQKDKSRDRDLQSKGIHVLRFTGSEIWRDPKKCAAEVMDAVKALSEVFKEL